MLIRLNTLSVQLQNDLQLMLFRVSIVQSTVSVCCDFIAQCTLVCINHLYLSFVLFTLNLQRSTVVGSACVQQWMKEQSRPYRDCSFIHSNHIHRLVNIPSITASSYLAGGRRFDNNWTGRNFKCSLGGHPDSNTGRFGRIHGRECPGDRLDFDRVQYHQGVLGKQGYFCRASVGIIELNRGSQTSAYYIHYNRIRYGVVCHQSPTLVRVVITSLVELQAGPAPQSFINALYVVIFLSTKHLTWMWL